jgi:hypothetical protein
MAPKSFGIPAGSSVIARLTLLDPASTASSACVWFDKRWFSYTTHPPPPLPSRSMLCVPGRLINVILSLANCATSRLYSLFICAVRRSRSSYQGKRLAYAYAGIKTTYFEHKVGITLFEVSHILKILQFGPEESQTLACLYRLETLTGASLQVLSIASCAYAPTLTTW